jgi:hypothetical protein
MFAPRILFVILLCSLTGCQSISDVTQASAKPSVRSDTFKVVTYNTLHGLEVSKLWVRKVESDEGSVSLDTRLALNNWPTYSPT